MLSVMIMALAQMKHESMVIGFTRQAMQYSPPGQKLQKVLPQTILRDGSSHSLKVLQERVLKR